MHMHTPCTFQQTVFFCIRVCRRLCRLTPKTQRRISSPSASSCSSCAMVTLPFLKIPAIGSTARGTDKLNCTTHGSRPPCVEQFNVLIPRAMDVGTSWNCQTIRIYMYRKVNATRIALPHGAGVVFVHTDGGSLGLLPRLFRVATAADVRSRLTTKLKSCLQPTGSILAREVEGVVQVRPCQIPAAARICKTSRPQQSL